VRIVVTRAESQADPLADRIEALGHEVVRCPLIRIEPLRGEPVDPSGYDWVVVTSPNGAAELARRLIAPPARIAAIGHGTADALAAHGLHADLVPQVSTQEGLLAELPPGRVLLAAAEGARRLLVDERDADFVPLYRTVELQPPAPFGDLVLLASPSAVRAFAATGARIPAVAIGPQTAAAALALGLEVAAVAASHDVEGLLEAVTSISH
jgi:uroporphyrinogen-III synthase